MVLDLWRLTRTEVCISLRFTQTEAEKKANSWINYSQEETQGQQVLACSCESDLECGGEPICPLPWALQAAICLNSRAVKSTICRTKAGAEEELGLPLPLTALHTWLSMPSADGWLWDGMGSMSWLSWVDMTNHVINMGTWTTLVCWAVGTCMRLMSGVCFL